MSQRRRQSKLTSIAVVVAVLDERRLQACQRAQARKRLQARKRPQARERPHANQFSLIDELEVILTSPLSRTCIVGARNPRNFVQDLVSSLVPVSESELEMSLLLFEIEQLNIEEEDEDDDDVCVNSRAIIKTTLRVDKKIV
jgi:hypothetical protein